MLLSLLVALALLPLTAATAHETGPQLLVSTNGDRSGAASLTGATLRGDAYVFLPEEGDVESVQFWLDNTAMSGSPRSTESQAPYDFAGGSVAAANAFDTTTVADGPHAISAKITYTDGHVQTLTNNFVIANSGAAEVLRINAGGPAVTTGGVSWQADDYFQGGKSWGNAAPIAGTDDDVLYQTERSATSNLGSFTYHLPAAVPGTYQVKLHFAEIYWGAPGGGPGGTAKRVFDVVAEGATVLDDYDINAAVGAATATTASFMIPVADGTLNLSFSASADQPKVSAIELIGPSGSTPPPDEPTPEEPGPAGPVTRINAGGPAVTVAGNTWSADAYFTGGKTYAASSSLLIADTDADVLYRTERSSDGGSFGYAIPAPAAGTYRVKLHLAEIYWGAPGGGPGGAGKRVFSVDTEGGTVELPNYDINAEVGPATAVVKTFDVPVTDGTLNVDFSAAVDQPKVSALEIVAPSGSTPLPTDPPPGGEVPTVPDDGQGGAFSWQNAAPSPIGRSEAQGAAIGTKLYAFGGFTSDWLQTTARADVYDASMNSWQQIADMPEELTHSAVVVDGTTIWLVGGYVGDHPGPATTSVWKYNTVTDTWSAGPKLPEPRGGGGAGIIGRTLYFFGGTSRPAGTTLDPDEPDVWALNLDGGTSWTAKAGLPNPRNHIGSAVVGGKLYAIGGQHKEDETHGLQNDLHRYDPATNAWTALADMPTARSHTGVVVRDGQIIVVGGTEPGNVASADATVYHPATNTWSKLPDLPAARKTPVTGLVGNTLYVSTGSYAATTWKADLSDRWETGSPMPVALGEVAAGVIGKTMYMVGEGSNKTLALDLATGTWRQDLAVRPYAVHHHAAEVVNGMLYLIGGLESAAGKVQIYDPAKNSWSIGADMPFAAGSAASAVIGGKIYVAGGIVGAGTTNRAAVYDPATNKWTELAPMPAGRNHAAAATDGSKLYVAGGRGPGSGDMNVVANGYNSLQVYDPATNTWRSSTQSGSGLAPLPQARGGMGKAVFLGGELYMMGGETLNGPGATSSGVYDRVDVYNPATNTWRLAAPMPTARHGIYPVLVGNRVVVAGGGVHNWKSESAVTEIYTP